MTPRPTDEEFAELARQRDESVMATIKALSETHGFDLKSTTIHMSHAGKCYCACPDGPCQHIWDGPTEPIGLEEGEPPESALCWSSTCSRCGISAMSHDMRCGP